MNPALNPPQSVEAGLTLSDLVKIFRRRRRILYGVLIACILMGILYCLFATRRYVASGTIQVQDRNPGGVDLTSLNGTAANAGVDALELTMNLQTQAGILQSDSLALRVIQDLNLERNEDFKGHFNPIGAVMGLFSPKGISDPPNASLENSPGRRTRLLKTFTGNLSVKQTAGTRLIVVSYTNPDPQVAAAVVNHLIQGLQDYSFQTKSAATSEASSFLNGQLADLRQQSEEQQAKVAELEKQTGLLTLGPDAQGREQVYSAVLDRLQQSTTALSGAQSNRILKEAVYKAARSGNADLISELSGTGGGNATPAVNNSLTLIQNLRQQQATLESEIAQDEQRYGSAYPKMEELRASLAGLRRAIDDEVARVAGRARNDYDVARQTEAETRAVYEANHRAADQLKDKAVDYTILKEEATQTRLLYEDLQKKLKEAGMLEGLRASNIAVVDPGRAPAKPKKPNVPVYLALSLFAGAFLGACGALLAESLETRIQTTEDFELLGIPLLGILPEYSRNQSELGGLHNVSSLRDPGSAYSEATRSLRSSLMVANTAFIPKVVLVTSAVALEGKSLTARNLAVSAAQSGKRVLLVDANLRRQSLDSSLDLSNAQGLSTLLASAANTTSGIVQTAVLPNLFALTGGPVSSSTADLLNSPRMLELITQWRSQFDLIVLDGPPVLPIVDALLLSNVADFTMLVARQGVTSRDFLKRAYQLLGAHTSASRIGVVLNGVSTRSDTYSSYFGSRTYHYYGGRVDENP